MIEAVIFDMDGVIIDSEPFWREAEIKVFKGIGVPMTEEMCVQMKGTKIDEVVRHWYLKFNWKDPSVEEVERLIIDTFISIVQEKGEAMHGLSNLLEFLKEKNLKVGLATSSPVKIMNAVLGKLNLNESFDIKHSAELEKNGKPAPDVYLGAARRLEVQPKNCLAIEDSYAGILAARSAGMFTIVIPEAPDFEDEKYDIADIKIRTLNEIIQLDIIG